MKKHLWKFVIGGFVLVTLILVFVIVNMWQSQKDDTKQARTVSDLVATAQESKGIDRTKVLVVGLDNNYPPMTFTSGSGQLTGFDVDLANAVAGELGKKAQFVALDWGKKDDDLNSGRIDVIWSGMVITPERQQVYSFTNPYMKNHKIAAVRIHSNINTAEDLADTIVNVQKGSTSITFMQNFKTPESGSSVKQVQEVSTIPEQLLNLLERKSDAAVSEQTAINYYVKRSPGKFRVIDGIDNEEVGLGVIAKKGNSELVSQLNGALDKVRASGKLQEISAKWFGN